MNAKTAKLFRKYARENAKPGYVKQAYKRLKKEFKAASNES
jgi:hypothetical protein